MQSAALKDLYLPAQSAALHCVPARAGIGDFSTSSVVSTSSTVSAPCVSFAFGGVAALGIGGEASAERRLLFSQTCRGPPP